MSSAVQTSTADSPETGSDGLLPRAMVGTHLAVRSLSDRVSSLRERAAQSPAVWFVVVIVIGIAIVAALVAFCVSQGYSGVSGYYKIGESWYDVTFRVGCS